MSMIQELEAAMVDCAKAKADLAVAAARMTDLEKAVAETKATLETERKANAAALESSKAMVESLKAANEKMTAELEAAQKALANPAFAVAAVAGDKAAVKEGGNEAVQELTYEQACAEYNKITDPVARKAYREKNGKTLRIA